MVPITGQDHEMTTLVKIGNIESETETSFAGDVTTDLPEIKLVEDTTTVVRVVEESSAEPEVKAIGVDLGETSSPSVEWTTEGTQSEEEVVTIEPEVVNINPEEKVLNFPSSEDVQTITAESLPIQTTTTPVLIESSTTQIEISFSLPDNKEMLEEAEQKIKDIIEKLADEMSSTTLKQVTSEESNPNVVDVTESEDEVTTQESPVQVESRENNFGEAKEESTTTTSTTSTTSTQQPEIDQDEGRTTENSESATDATIKTSEIHSDLVSDTLEKVLPETITNTSRNFEETSTPTVPSPTLTTEGSILTTSSLENELISSSSQSEELETATTVKIDSKNNLIDLTTEAPFSTTLSELSSNDTAEEIGDEALARPRKL